ncbi:MAG: hypothetical protein M3Y87_02470 [Myxococcota bacterium]|nr:hypothetical protein [Myxococcota bacterium]
MRWVFALVVAVHGVIHLMGFAKAFGLAALPQLTLPISRPMGVLWLIAAALTLASAVLVFAWPRGWWAVGGVAVVVSQLVIVSSWSDAKAGTIANVILLLGVVYGLLTRGPTSFRAEYEHDASAARSIASTSPITEADLARLPPPVQQYLRVTGALGQPRVERYRARFRGRIRSGPDAAWMPFEADQQSVVDPPTRLFLMDATMYGLPVQAFHRYVGPSATMRVKLAGIVPIVEASGPVMDESETVTLFNDMCVLAPGSLLEPSIAWEAVDASTARARFTNGAHTISATLSFDDEGFLTSFVSDDRSRASADGRSFTRQRWSTPLREPRLYGAVRLASRGDARWHAPDGELVYVELEVLEIDYGAP